MDLSRGTISQLRELYAKGEATPLDVVDALLSAIDARDGEVRAYLEVFADDLRSEAAAMTKRGDYASLPLGGVPVAIKDNICTAGKRTSCGSRILEGYRSPYDATAVKKLRAAGALVIGKTNLDEFAMGSSTENSAFGPVHNPWDAACSPGGSSGGSAAAVAADIAFASLGSDTGGSIRQPASFCGVVGMKPTYGRVSRYGLVAFASSLDQIGPFAKNVRDTAHVLGVISGRDENDATSMDTPVGDFASDIGRGCDGLRVGVPRAFVGDNMSPDVKRNFDETLNRIESSGAMLCDIDLPHADYGVAAYYIIANAEASANLARFDGVKYGHRTASPADLYDMYTATRDEGFGDEVKRRILLGTYVLSAGYYDAYYEKAQRVRSLIIRDYEAAFSRCDLIISPTSPTPAFRLGEKIDDPILMYLSDVFTIPVNLAGLPGISVPSGLSADRLPLGIQLTARPLDEATLFRGAAGIESVVSFEERAFG